MNQLLEQIRKFYPFVWPAALVVIAAIATSLVSSPIVGVPALAIIVWTNGTSIVLLAMGNPKLDLAFYSIASVLVGLATLMFTTLIVFTLGIKITEGSMATAIALVGVVLAVVSAPQRRARWLVREHTDPMNWLYWGATIAVLVGATGFAAAVQKKEPDTWTLMSVSGDIVRTGDPLTADPGTQVEVDWQLETHGYIPPTSNVEVAAEVGKVSQSAATQTSFTTSTDGAKVVGQTVVVAPAAAGLYRVQIRATTYSEQGTPVTTSVNVHLKVNPVAPPPTTKGKKSR